MTTRRDFIKGVGAVGIAVALPVTAIAKTNPIDESAVVKPYVQPKTYEELIQLLSERGQTWLQQSIFELNDGLYRNMTICMFEEGLKPFVQSTRLLYDFRVVFDETLNPPSAIDRNERYFDIYLKPTKSIPFDVLSFGVNEMGTFCHRNWRPLFL